MDIRIEDDAAPVGDAPATEEATPAEATPEAAPEAAPEADAPAAE